MSTQSQKSIKSTIKKPPSHSSGSGTRMVKDDIGLVFENDGEFYMNFNQHFLKYFGEIEVVHINPTNIECSLRDWAKTFDVFHMFGKWEDEAAEGAVGASLGRN